ncbi:GNAT family N-acetyltransferase [Collinsella tanakaei]|nr:GNAT family N-acetyltransferase [Collinsella tanakaei]
MSSTLIRPIATADDAAVAIIIRSCLEAYRLDIPGTAYFDPELDHLSRFYASRPGLRAYFVMEDTDSARIIGGAGLAEYEGLDTCCELQKIYLVESERGRGRGLELLEAVEAQARKLGYRRIYLETHTSLHEAIRLYERCGYRCIDRPATAIHSTMDRFYLKEL